MQPLSGFRDFLPASCAERNYIFAKWREVAGRYGFVEFDGPVLEELDLYKKKSGDEIVRQLYEFVDKGDRAVALRPEMTPTLARIVAAEHRQFRKPLKWFSIPQVFRYERPQRGRLREHFQLNCDIIGEESLEADAELIALAIDVVRTFGFTAEDFVVRISDRKFWTELLKLEKVPPDRWEEILQTIDKSEREPREKTQERLGKLAKPVFEILEKGGESAKLNNIIENLRTRGRDLRGHCKRRTARKCHCHDAATARSRTSSRLFLGGGKSSTAIPIGRAKRRAPRRRLRRRMAAGGSERLGDRRTSFGPSRGIGYPRCGSVITSVSRGSPR